MAEVAFIEGYVPGAIGRVAEMHGVFYAREWGFGQFFEAKVATDLAQFLERYDPARDLLRTAVVNNRIEGSIAIDGLRAPEQGAHLRWFIVSPDLRGRGIGSQLLSRAIDFCRTGGHGRVFLWTFAGLDVARSLYERHGFRLTEQRWGSRWGTAVNEQRFELDLLRREPITPGAAG